MPVKVCLTLLPKRKKQKWRYIYNDSELKKYSKGATEVTESNTPDGHKTSTVKYKQSNSLFDKESYVKNKRLVGDRAEESYTTKSQGKLSRARARGERRVYNTFLKK